MIFCNWTIGSESRLENLHFDTKKSSNRTTFHCWIHFQSFSVLTNRLRNWSLRCLRVKKLGIYSSLPCRSGKQFSVCGFIVMAVLHSSFVVILNWNIQVMPVTMCNIDDRCNAYYKMCAYMKLTLRSMSKWWIYRCLLLQFLSQLMCEIVSRPTNCRLFKFCEQMFSHTTNLVLVYISF